MFAPPPPTQLSTAEIEARNAAQGLERRRKSSASEQASPLKSGKSVSSLLKRSNMQNKSSTKKNDRRATPPRLLLPPTAPPPALPPPETPILPGHLSEPANQRQMFKSYLKGTKPDAMLAQQPKRASGPPKRPPRPPSELFLPTPVSTSSSSMLLPVGSRFDRERSPARQPSRDKSPLKHVPSSRGAGSSSSRSPLSGRHLVSSPRGPSKAKDGARSGAASIAVSNALQQQQRTVEEQALETATGPPPGGRAEATLPSSVKGTTGPEIAPMIRSSTAPPTFNRIYTGFDGSASSVSSPTSLVRGRGALSRNNAKATRRSLDVQAAHPGRRGHAVRMSPATSFRAALLDFDDPTRLKRKTDAIIKSARPDMQSTKSRKIRKGETMSMLLDSGFFPVEELIYSGESTPSKLRTSQMYRINLPPRLSFFGGDLPNSPFSLQPTPTEMYRYSLSSPRRSKTARNRRSSMTERSPLSPMSTNVRSPGAGYFDQHTSQTSPNGQLTAIPENGADADENVISPSTVIAPVATEIHLRGGSVITVTPPELTAWKPAIYIPGPIMLLKPAIVPRKNSVASLEPFQDMVDQLYQHALPVPRRRSDDAVVDDIVDFFDDFGFDLVRFDGDVLKPFAIDMTEETDVDFEPERFTTPPSEPAGPSLKPWIPPVENEETLRAKGIARLSRMSAESSGSKNDAPSRKESVTIGRPEDPAQLPLLPAPEVGILGPIYSPTLVASTRSSSARDTASIFSAKTGTASTGDQGFDWDDDLEEISASSSWTAPALAPKRPGFSKGLIEPAKKSRNPISRIRKLAATASTVL